LCEIELIGTQFRAKIIIFLHVIFCVALDLTQCTRGLAVTCVGYRDADNKSWWLWGKVQRFRACQHCEKASRMDYKGTCISRCI